MGSDEDGKNKEQGCSEPSNSNCHESVEKDLEEHDQAKLRERTTPNEPVGGERHVRSKDQLKKEAMHLTTATSGCTITNDVQDVQYLLINSKEEKNLKECGERVEPSKGPWTPRPKLPAGTAASTPTETDAEAPRFDVETAHFETAVNDDMGTVGAGSDLVSLPGLSRQTRVGPRVGAQRVPGENAVRQQQQRRRQPQQREIVDVSLAFSSNNNDSTLSLANDDPLSAFMVVDSSRIKELEQTVEAYHLQEKNVVNAAVVEVQDDKKRKGRRTRTSLRRPIIYLLCCTVVLVVVATVVVYILTNDSEIPIETPTAAPTEIGEQVWEQIGSDIDGEAPGDYFGADVAMSVNASRIAIAGNFNDGNGKDSGHVRVVSLDDEGNWSQVGTDIDGKSAEDQSGLGIAMSADGNRIVVGSPTNGDNGSDAGQVRVFEWDISWGDWLQLGDDILGGGSDEFGKSVTMSADGNRIAASNGDDAGAVSAFVWNGTARAWEQLGHTMEGGENGDRLGGSLSMSADGNRIAADSHGRVKAVAFDWDDDSGSWLRHNVYEGNGDATTLGMTMSTNGQRIASGAEGYVRVFAWYDTSSTWVQVGEDIHEERIFNSGRTIALSEDGNRIAFSRDETTKRGFVRVFEFDVSRNKWIRVGLIIEGEDIEDEFGAAISMSHNGKMIAVGARKNNGKNGTQSGHVRVYKEEGF